MKYLPVWYCRVHQLSACRLFSIKVSWEKLNLGKHIFEGFVRAKVQRIQTEYNVYHMRFLLFLDYIHALNWRY
jgi:hypothetical protein